MHDSDKVVVHLGDFDDCPVWWQHMVNHLEQKHSPWHMQDNLKIIQDYLITMYQAHYSESELVWHENMVEFPHKESYYACVLMWS